MRGNELTNKFKQQLESTVATKLTVFARQDFDRCAPLPIAWISKAKYSDIVLCVLFESRNNSVLLSQGVKKTGWNSCGFKFVVFGEITADPGLKFVALINAVYFLRIRRFPPDFNRRGIDCFSSEVRRRCFRD